MATLKNKIERLEKEQRFKDWLYYERFAESLSVEQLEELATRGYFTGDPPEPLPQGASRLDCMDHESLLKLWKEREVWLAKFYLRSHDDQEFFCLHGHWPEQSCNELCANKAKDLGLR